MFHKKPAATGLCFLLVVFCLSALAFAFAPDTNKTSHQPPVRALAPVFQATADADFQIRMGDTYGPFLRFKSQYGPDWFLRMDRRTLRPAMVWGSGIPWVPAEVQAAVKGAAGEKDAQKQVAAYLGARAASFMEENGDLLKLRIDGRNLSLNVARAATLADNRLWFVVYSASLDGVPIQDAEVFFRVNSGNLIQFGVQNIGDALATAPTVPAVAADPARAAAIAYAGGADLSTTHFLDYGTLWLLPRAENPSKFEGTPGEGLDYQLAWRFSFKRKGEIPTWVAYVDAETGEVAAFYDANVYECTTPAEPQARVKGGVFKRTPEDPEEMRPMPYALVLHGGNVTADYNGIYPMTPGVLSETGLNGTYFNVSCDTCQNPPQAYVSNPGGGDLDLGMGGSDTMGNGFSVPSERNTFYHLNHARAMASKFLTDAAAGGFLTRNTPANVNIMSTCNAFWDGNAVNFFAAGGGCNNTGEISDVVQHEWGHGLDQATTPTGVIDGARGEGLADTVAVLASHSPVMSPYFFVGDPSGIRNVDEVSGPRGILTVANLLSKCPAGGGPNGAEVHCEGELFGQVNWRLGVNLRNKYGAIGGWYALERIFYLHMPLANTYVPNQSGSAYDAYIAVDDDDGNLANGTPNAEAINDAFSAHGIASTPMAADSAECAPPTAPAPTLAVLTNPDTQLYQVKVTWNGVAGANQYDVLRNENGQGESNAIVGTVLPPFPPNPVTLIDDSVMDGRTYYYEIRVFKSGCVSTNDTTRSVTVASLAHLGYESYQIDDSAGNQNGVVEPGETITMPVTIVNQAADVTNAVVTLSTPTTGVTITRSQEQYGTITAGATDTSDAPHFAFSVAPSVVCGSTITFNLAIETDQGCSYAAFQVQVGAPMPPTVFVSDDMETDTGWTVDPQGTDDARSGIWVREDPNPTQYVPDADHTPTGTLCWLTGNGTQPGQPGFDDVDGGCTTLQSPTWDLTGQTGLDLAYWRWYVLETNYDDQFLVEISNNGGTTWQTLETLGQTTTPWTEARFDLQQALGAPPARVALRFTACDQDPGSLVEALVDDVKFEKTGWICEDPKPRPRLAFSSYQIDDGTAGGRGNQDGIVDPGETIVLPLTLENIGNGDARAVTGTLRIVSAPPGVVLRDNYATFADITPGATQVSGGPAPLHYALYIGTDDEQCGKEIQLALDFSYSDGSNPYTGTGTFSFHIGSMSQVQMFFDDFESAGNNGWTHVQIATQDDWQHGAPSSGSAYDPPAAYSGTRCWGNDLGITGGDGDYRANVDNYLESPAIDLTDSVNTRLTFRRWLSVEDGIYDHAILSVNGTEIWRNPGGGGEDHTIDTSWVEESYDISSVADGNPAVRIRFELQSDGGLQFGGWNIDDVRIVSEQWNCNRYGCALPLPDPVGNTLKLVKNASNANLDWTAYTGNGTAFNVYRAQSQAELPIQPSSLQWPGYATKTLSDPMQPADPPLYFYVVKALNGCPEEE
jgi:hypothetical protein